MVSIVHAGHCLLINKTEACEFFCVKWSVWSKCFPAWDFFQSSYVGS